METLSDKTYKEGTCLLVEDVKEFIRQVKELSKHRISKCEGWKQTFFEHGFEDAIDKLAGSALI